MANKNKIYFLLVAALMVSLISCNKNDAVTPPEVSQPVELFSKDSISVYSSDSGNVMLADSIMYDISDSTIKDIKLQYNMETSGGNTGDRVYYGIFLSKPGVSYYSNYGYPAGNKIIDTTITFNIVNYKGLTLTAKVAIEHKASYDPRYSRFKNIKLIKVD